VHNRGEVLREVRLPRKEADQASRQKIEGEIVSEHINRLIPADELHWNEHDRKYSVVSEEETERIIKICFESELGDEDIYRVVQDYVYVKTGQLLYRHLLEGDIVIGGVDGDGKPIFVKRTS